MATVIVRGYAEAGYVVGADGRQTELPSYKIICDTTQKIFQVGGSVAYCMRGVTLLGDCRETEMKTVYFDLGAKFAEQVSSMSMEGFGSLQEYGKVISAPIHAALRNVCKTSQNIHLPHRALVEGPILGWEIATFFLDGYVQGAAQRTAITFWHDDTTSGEPLVESEPVSLGLIPYGPAGPLKKFQTEAAYHDEVLKEIPNSATHENPELRSMVRDGYGYIRSCSRPGSERLDPDCQGVGGRIHIATITRERGFRWVPECEPIT